MRFTRSFLLLSVGILGFILLAPTFAALPLLAQNDVLIMKPGDKATVGNPYRENVVGTIPIGDRRFVFVRFLEVEVTNGDGDVTGMLSSKKVQIHATDRAKPGIYRVRTSIYVEDQIYRRTGRRARWMRIGNHTNHETFNVLVDIDTPPPIYIPVGVTTKIQMPRVVKFEMSKSRSKAVADVTSYANDITIETKKKGTAKLAVNYSIEGTERSQKWTVKVVEDAPRFEETFAAGTKQTLDVGPLMKELNATRISIEGIDPGSTAGFCTVELVEHKVELRAHATGQGSAFLRVHTVKGRKEMWHIIPIDIEVTAPPADKPSPPSPAPPAKKKEEKDTEEEDLEEEDIDEAGTQATR